MTSTINTFHHAFHAFIWRNDVLAAVIPGNTVGWCDGGCRSLLKAITLWLGDAAIPYQLVKTPDQQHAEHVVARIGDWYVDGDGISTRDELIRRWIDEEHMPNTLVVRPFDPATEPPHGDEPPYYLPDIRIERLAALLSARFDPICVIKLLN